MIRFLFRFVGLLGLALGFFFVVYDGANWITNRALNPITVERIWDNIYSKPPQSVLQPLVAPIGNWLWDPMIVYFLAAPAWLVLVVLASLLMILGRKKKPLIGYARDRS
jgi:hypothetical protein